MTLLKKDLKLEFRSKEIILSTFVLGLSMLLVFALSFQNQTKIIYEFSSGILWIVILFISTFGLNRAFSIEQESSSMWSWLSSPIDRGLVFLSKMVSISIYVLLAEIMFLIPFFIFLKIPTNFSLINLIIIILVGTLAVTAIGCLISTITLQTRIRNVLIPILLFPSCTPIIISATKSTLLILKNKAFIDWSFWLLLMITFFIIFSLFGYIIFDRVIEE
ncbi:MAG: heme exporter protein CcmB [Candidatus Neomarinimicrobiota bacterium]|tara:strand:- start:323 stop:979 length:657 start_codon:yes stop_codon:yes gene_type:complete